VGSPVCIARRGWVNLTFLFMNKPVYRTVSQHRTADVLLRSEPRQPGEPSPVMIVESVVFTSGEHFRAQQQIERRARELWCAGGCRPGTALNDWLQAEREVLEQFIWTYARGHALRQASRQEASVNVTRKKSDTRILKRGRTVAARDLQSTSARV
jgi:hypothetical protein